MTGFRLLRWDFLGSQKYQSLLGRGSRWGFHGELVCGPGSVYLSQPSKQRVSQGDPKRMVPGSLEEKEVHEKKKLEKNNTNAWEKLEVNEEECKSKLVLPQPPRLVKQARRRKVKLPERVEGQPEIRNFLEAAWGCQPKIPQEMQVPNTDCEAN